MIRRTTLLSAITISLLLAACSKNPDQSDSDMPEQDAGEAQAQVVSQADYVPLPTAARLDYWSVVGPLVAGSYGGSCLRLPDARKLDARVDIKADGKVAAGGIDVDFREAHEFMLMRMGDNGQNGTAAMFEMQSNKEGALSLQSNVGAKGTVSLARDEIGVICEGVDGVAKLDAMPPHRLLAKLVKTEKQTLGCLDTRDFLTKRNMDIELDGSVIRVGDAAYDARTAANEILTIKDKGESTSLMLLMPDKQTITLIYDGEGKLKSLVGINPEHATHSCDRK